MTDGKVRARPLTFDWELRFTQAATRNALAYWNKVRGSRPMPSRDDLDPVAMRRFTEHVGLIEIRSESGGDVDYFIRRAGTKWEEVFGPMTGRLIHEFLPPEIEMMWRQVFDLVRSAKAPVRVTTGIKFQRKNWLDAEMFIAPLGDAEPTMLFMTFVSSRA